MKLKSRIYIQVWGIKITKPTKDGERGWYEFNYSVVQDGKLRVGYYDGTFTIGTAKYRRILEGGEAIKLVIERVF